jgi:hypothetical protein
MEGAGQEGKGRGALERCADGEAAQTVSGGGVQQWQGSSGGRRRAWRGLATRGRPGGEEAAVNWGMGQLRGRHRRGADGGDARTESGVEEGLRWRKTGEEDTWAMGTNVRRSGVDGRDERRVG